MAATLLVVVLAAMLETAECSGEYEVTAYCPCAKCCERWADGATSDGTILSPRSRVVAAPRGIPFDTMLYVPGYGLARVADRGGAIKGRRLDVFFWTHEEALQWGRRRGVQVRRLRCMTFRSG